MYPASHPSRVRGLKLRYTSTDGVTWGVAPFTGAWIETVTSPHPDVYTPSHPSRVRGLKLLLHVGATVLGMSHPSRVRGLKLDTRGDLFGREHVAPFTGAWIETDLVAEQKRRKAESHPSRVRGLKLFSFFSFRPQPGCRTLHGCVD